MGNEVGELRIGVMTVNVDVFADSRIRDRFCSIEFGKEENTKYSLVDSNFAFCLAFLSLGDRSASHVM